MATIEAMVTYEGTTGIDVAGTNVEVGYEIYGREIDVEVCDYVLVETAKDLIEDDPALMDNWCIGGIASAVLYRFKDDEDDARAFVRALGARGDSALRRVVKEMAGDTSKEATEPANVTSPQAFTYADVVHSNPEALAWFVGLMPRFRIDNFDRLWDSDSGFIALSASDTYWSMRASEFLAAPPGQSPIEAYCAGQGIELPMIGFGPTPAPAPAPVPTGAGTQVTFVRRPTVDGGTGVETTRTLRLYENVALPPPLVAPAWAGERQTALTELRLEQRGGRPTESAHSHIYVSESGVRYCQVFAGRNEFVVAAHYNALDQTARGRYLASEPGGRRFVVAMHLGTSIAWALPVLTPGVPLTLEGPGVSVVSA